jgi:hypothetical protein
MRLADHVDPKRLKEANLMLLLEGAKDGADLEDMMLGSRKLVKQAHRPAADAPRMATVAALRNLEHPARQFYAGFEAKLKEIARKT